MDRPRDRYGDYAESHNNSHSATSCWSEDRPTHYDRNFEDHRSNFPGDGNNHHHRHNHHHHSNDPHHHSSDPHHHSSNNTPNDSIGGGGECGTSHSFPLSGRKRQFSHTGLGTSPDFIDRGGFVKLYVGAVPRTVTEEDIRSVFGEHGDIIEVILLKDKRTGQQQECCFVKYATLDAADRAIGALNSQYTFPWGMMPIKVKYADGERERLGICQSSSGTGNIGAHVYKLYVGCLNKQASRREVEEMFSPYGLVEDVYIVRDEWKQNRGCAFVQFSHRDMAVAAINALHGTFMMEGCDQPLIVRFADPKKPRAGESRGHSKFGAPGFGPCLQDSIVRSAASHSDPEAGQTLHNDLHPPSPKQSPRIRSKPHIVSSNFTASEQVLPSGPPVAISAQTADLPDCDWSEHICPDGYNYYYNCVTCESRVRFLFSIECFKLIFSVLPTKKVISIWKYDK
ncbi:unnamed protein product [Ilex paraguariensis]|uniref:RRM domain-containing protein n=1 Tax=Ilex paraguariensis TaxID=185542 RepID=A0ABC8S7R0_9AQUA